MSTRNWVGLVLTFVTFGMFGYVLHRGVDLTATVGLIFGGALLFCGLLLDFDHFAEVFRIWRKQP